MNSNRTGSGTTNRGQANLPVVAVALVVLTAATGMTVAMAEGALLTAERDAGERAAAATAADRLVAADADHTRRSNVLGRDAVESLSPDAVVALAPAVDDAEFRVRVGGETVVERGDPNDGTTVRRIGLLAADDEWTGSVTTTAGDELTVPRRTETLIVEPAAGVETVRVNDRVVLSDPDPTDSPMTVSVTRYETLTVTATGDEGRVDVESTPETTEKAAVEVTVDA